MATESVFAQAEKLCGITWPKGNLEATATDFLVVVAKLHSAIIAKFLE